MYCHSRSFLFCVFLFLFGSLSVFAQTPNEKVTIQISNVIIGRSYQLPSKVYSTKREINIWLPPNYKKESKRYPTVYLVDGGTQTGLSSHFGDSHSVGTINKNYEELIIVGIKNR